MSDCQANSLMDLWPEAWPQTRTEMEALIERFQDRLVRCAFRRVGNLQDAEDIVQEIFVRAYSIREKFRHVNQVGPYLFRMTANACTDFLRKRGRFPEIQVNDGVVHLFADQQPDSLEMMKAREEWRRMETWLGKLPQRQAEIIRFRVFDELRFGEIAEILGCSEATVKSRFRYGIEKLKTHVLREQETAR